MGRIVIRLAVPNEQRRFLSSGLLTGTPSSGGKWEDRLATWFAEQTRAHRLILVADDGSNFLGCVHVLFKPPPTMNDPEVVNGKDVALMEHLRIKPKILATLAEQVAEQLEREAENVARKRGMTRLTYMVPGDATSLLNQAHKWNFVDFRIMQDSGKQLVFMRKRLVEFKAEPHPEAAKPADGPAPAAAPAPAPPKKP